MKNSERISRIQPFTPMTPGVSSRSGKAEMRVYFLMASEQTARVRGVAHRSMLSKYPVFGISRLVSTGRGTRAFVLSSSSFLLSYSLSLVQI